MTEPTPLSGTFLYLDSNVFIYAFEGRSGALRETASMVIRRVFDGKIHAARAF